MTNRGKFIVFEGIDGAGKTTQAKRLCDALKSRGVSAIFTREPTDGPWGLKIRNIAATGRDGLTLEQELEWFLKDREDHVNALIIPAIDAGTSVICDRYFYSTIAYQGALGLDPESIRYMNEVEYRFPVPDVVFYLKVDPGAGLDRIETGRAGGANVGYEKEDFLCRVKSFFDNMNDECIVRLDGTAAPDAIAADIQKIVLDLLK